MFLLPIILPDGFTKTVSVGDKVEFDQPIASCRIAKEEVIPVAKQLHLAPAKIISKLKVKPGQNVEAGDILIENAGFLGFKPKSTKSPYKATIVRLSEDTGDLVIKQFAHEEIIKSPLEGIVDSCDNEKIVIKTKKEVFPAKKAFGQTQEAEILFLQKKEYADLQINKNNVYKKVVMNTCLSREEMFKILGLQASGIICVNAEDRDFDDLKKYAESFCLFLLEEKLFDDLTNHINGKFLFQPLNKLIVGV